MNIGGWRRPDRTRTFTVDELRQLAEEVCAEQVIDQDLTDAVHWVINEVVSDLVVEGTVANATNIRNWLQAAADRLERDENHA